MLRQGAMPRYKPVQAGQAARKTVKNRPPTAACRKRSGRERSVMDMVSCRRQKKGEGAKSEIDLAAGTGILRGPHLAALYGIDHEPFYKGCAVTIST
ncbi:hypothetical protein AA0473_0989 [Acetobacter orleanensis NRIC 0473]|uniref:Uncharacterized protein n=1 Tax=Acetobacter orleanensis TaxID=104099 RepID=A0A4Y3TMF9_9PROT|nr:hypothetical protein Abol_026_018 [Acetobacter orleanensis JCM 7639]GBR25823.1 hypothetical protein AA0473_0989 [Acetobacter orleanensis NRIC 0473]GEB82619.1 hypothetical protein AOR01nite_10960 [Acetobacter orleanensis]